MQRLTQMKRTAIYQAAVLVLLSILLSGCLFPADQTPPPPLPTRPPVTPQPTTQPFSGAAVVISEVLGGIQGNNNVQFVELYNRTGQAIDLNGYTLWFRLPTSKEDLLIYRWVAAALVPPYGHYLLARAEGAAQIPGSPVPDAEFSQPISPFDGGLVLRGPDGQPVDAAGWGKAPAGFFEGSPAPTIERGQSLERKPGGAQGSGTDSDNNQADFALSSAPGPQTTGDPAAPARAAQLLLQAIAPASVTPGSQFDYAIRITNQSDQNTGDLELVLPLPEPLKLLKTDETAPGLRLSDKNVLSGPLEGLAPGQSRTLQLTVQVPYTYDTLRLASYWVSAPSIPGLEGYGGTVLTRIEGGQVPIAAARGLNNAELAIEGTATMHTGGFYAGDGNTKFYLQDETGGIQVQVFGGEGLVSVRAGDHVRVQGKVGIYRDAVQIVPNVVPGDVTVTRADSEVSSPQPRAATFTEVLSGLSQPPETTLAGRLVQVQGRITRVEEFTYSYEIDLSSDEGQVLTLYVDKQTDAYIVMDALETGQDLRATGIVEARDGKVQLYPRGKDDLQVVYPPTARIEIDAPVTVAFGDVFTVTITAHNNTQNIIPQPLIALPLVKGTDIVKIHNGGAVFEASYRQGQPKRILWSINDLRPNGGSQSVQVTLAAHGDRQWVELTGYQLQAPSLVNPVSGPARLVYTSGKVPIGSVQGPGDRSPFTGSAVSITGIVTGSFPGLNGFWVQGESDDNRQTSDAIFIQVPAGAVPLPERGDSVQVSGTVRESSQQTVVQVNDLAAVRILQQGARLPAALEIDPPASVSAAKEYFEALEGMLVSLERAVAVSPTSNYGEYVVVRSDLGITRLYQGQPESNGVAVMVDDGTDLTISTADELPYVVRTGDVISRLVGPLAYTYDHFKIQPVQAPVVQTRPIDLPRIRAAEDGQISLMTWNTENLFDNRQPNPTDPPLPTLSQYQAALKKVAATIASAGAPDVIGLEEVENIDVLRDIAAQDALKSYGYQAYLEEGLDSRGIDVGFLVRPDRVEVLAVRQYADAEGVFPRPPLLIKLKTQGGSIFYAIVNHFTSMSGGVDSTEPRRVLQAQGNLAILDEIREEDPSALAAVIGDLNAYYHSAPIDTLRNGGLLHVFETIPAEQRYTYIYQGESQVLDHILVTQGLYDRIERVEVLHVNSDFPPAPPDDLTPLAKSDHDPVVVVFDLP